MWKVKFCGAWDAFKHITFIVHFASRIIVGSTSDQKAFEPELDPLLYCLFYLPVSFPPLECKPHEYRAYCLLFSLPDSQCLTVPGT